MYALTLEIIEAVLLSMKLKKLLIEKYSGYDDAVSQIIAADSRAAIRQNQEEILIFSRLLQRFSSNNLCPTN
jgi:hypothetical protein